MQLRHLLYPIAGLALVLLPVTLQPQRAVAQDASTAPASTAPPTSAPTPAPGETPDSPPSPPSSASPQDQPVTQPVGASHLESKPGSQISPAKTQLPANPINPSSPDFALILTFAALTVGIVIYPIARYLRKPWAFRRDRLFGLLAGDAIVWYYKQFRPGDNIKKAGSVGDSSVGTQTPPLMYPVGDPLLLSKDYMRCFASDFHTWYGRQYYIAPLIGLFALSAASAWWCLHTLWSWTTGYQENTRGLVATSLAGAFVWIISDEIDRLRRRDFTSSDVYYYVFRLLISIPFGWALTRLKLPLNTGVPIAFFLGAFPTVTLFTAARRIASEYLRLGEDPRNGTLELESLPSVGKDNAERFKDEGITTITQLAYADPVDLTIRTNFDFNYVVDCVSQALLWIYIPQTPALNQLSLRGAQEAATLIAWLKNSDPANKAHATLTAIAAELKMPEDALFTTLYQVALDPYTQFLVNAWSQAVGTPATFDRSGARLVGRPSDAASAISIASAPSVTSAPVPANTTVA